MMFLRHNPKISPREFIIQEHRQRLLVLRYCKLMLIQSELPQEKIKTDSLTQERLIVSPLRLIGSHDNVTKFE